MAFPVLEIFERPRSSPLRRNLRLSTLDAMTAAPIVYLNVGGNFIIAALVTQVFGVDNRVYGLIASLPAWCYALQVVLVPWLARRCTSRQLAIYGALMSALVWVAFVIGLSWMHRGDSALAARVIFATVALNCLAQSFASVGWTSWVQDWLPQRLRGRYFGFRYRALNLATIAFFLLVGWLTSTFTDGVRAYQLIFGVATVLRLLSVIYQLRMDAAPPAQPVLAHLHWRGQLARLAREKSYVRFGLFITATAFIQNLAAPFYPVFAYESLGLTVDQYSLMALLATIGAAATWPWWGRMADRHGCRNVIMLSIGGWALSDFFWPFLPRAHALWLLYGLWIWSGAVSCGYLVGNLNWLLKLVPAPVRVAGVSLNLAMSSLAAAIAPVLVGTMVDAAHRAGPHQADLAFRIVFFIRPTLMLLSLLIVRKVAEPEGTHFSALLDTLRAPYRALTIPMRPFLVYTQLARPEKRPSPPRE